MRILPILAFLLCAQAQAQITVTSGTPTLTLPSGGPWSTLGSVDFRAEFRLHTFGADLTVSDSLHLGCFYLWHQGPNATWMETSFSACADGVFNNGSGPLACCPGRSDVVMRMQMDRTNSLWKFEACNTAGGGCLSSTSPIGMLGSVSWIGQVFSLSTGYTMSFLHLFSTTVPIGTRIDLTPGGDIADWEFAGNAVDSVHGLAFTGGTFNFSTANPTYPPVCNAGVQNSFNVGTAGILDASQSYALNGSATLTPAWAETTAQGVVIANPAAISTTFTGFGRGPINFSLRVTDSSAQHTDCTVNHGAVVANINNVISTGNGSVDKVLGPLIWWGHNPWPWFDERHKAWADHIGDFLLNDPTYADDWNTALGGTAGVTNGSRLATGTGTNFPATFCVSTSIPSIVVSANVGTATFASAPGLAVGLPIAIFNSATSALNATYSILTVSPDGTQITFATSGVSNGTYTDGRFYLGGNGNNNTFVIWYPLGGGQFGKSAYGVTICNSATQIVLTRNYVDSSTTSGLNYSNWANVALWIGGSTNVNYYDNVMALYSLYYRSGIDTYLNLARILADRWWSMPLIDQGRACSSPSDGSVCLAARIQGMTGMWLREIDGQPGMLPGLRTYADYVRTKIAEQIASQLLSDTREQSFSLSVVGLCSMLDPDPTHNLACRTTTANYAAFWTANQYTDPDDGFKIFRAFGYGYSSFNGAPGTVSATNGSTTLTGTGTTWAAPNFDAVQEMWLSDTTTAFPWSCTAGIPNLVPGDSHGYNVTFVDSTHLTISPAYDTQAGTTGGHGWSFNNGSGCFAAPFHEAVFVAAAAYAYAGLNGTAQQTQADLYKAMAIDVAKWIVDKGAWTTDNATANGFGLGTFTVTGAGNVLVIAVDGGAPQTISLTTGTRTLAQIVTDINNQASGMTASTYFQGITLKSNTNSTSSSLVLQPITNSAYGMLQLNTGTYSGQVSGYFYSLDAPGCASPRSRLFCRGTDSPDTSVNSIQASRFLNQEIMTACTAGYLLSGDATIKSVCDVAYGRAFGVQGGAFSDSNGLYLYLNDNTFDWGTPTIPPPKWKDFGFAFGWGRGAAWPAAEAQPVSATQVISIGNRVVVGSSVKR